MENFDYREITEPTKQWTEVIKDIVHKSRKRRGIVNIGGIGDFAGGMEIPCVVREALAKEKCTAFEEMQKKLGTEIALRDEAYAGFSVVACADGAGTKSMIAEMFGYYDYIGQDVVAMNVNDMAAAGAMAFGFVDYIGCKEIIKDGKFVYEPYLIGLEKACADNGIELLGGETAKLKGVYDEFGSDLTGFAIGILLPSRVPPRDTIKPGDVVIAHDSGGFMSNGYTGLRNIIDTNGIDYYSKPDEFGGKTVLEMLMTPTRIFTKQAGAAFETGFVKSMAHITGGGLVENIERAIPKSTRFELDMEKIPGSKIFEFVLNRGKSMEELLETYNMGYGYAYVVSPENVGAIEDAVGEKLTIIGKIKDA